MFAFFVWWRCEKEIVNVHYYTVESLTYHTTPNSLRESMKVRWSLVAASGEPTVKKKLWFTVTFKHPMNTRCFIIFWSFCKVESCKTCLSVKCGDKFTGIRKQRNHWIIIKSMQHMQSWKFNAILSTIESTGNVQIQIYYPGEGVLFHQSELL